MTLADPAFPSSAAFDLISQSLTSSSEAKSEALKSGGKSIFAFTITNSAGTKQSWYIDLKSSGTVGKGKAPEGQNPDVTLLISEVDFGKLVAGTTKAQNLFMSGGLKVRGDLMKATKVETVLKNAQKAQEAPKAKL